MIYNGLDQNNMPTFNYARGHKTGNIDEDYVKGGHYNGINMNNNYTVYRYTGTPNEIK
jgi:hypothetical protein